MRREGLYASTLANFRQQRDEGKLGKDPARVRKQRLVFADIVEVDGATAHPRASRVYVQHSTAESIPKRRGARW